MPKKPPLLTEDDVRVWQSVSQTVDPLRPRPVRSPKPQQATSGALSKAAGSPVILPTGPQVSLTAAESKQIALDRKVSRRLRRGHQAIEATLDLHNMTVQQAHTRLQQFILQSSAGGLRCVLVITGKGQKQGRALGRLKQEVPQWLEQAPLASRLIGYCPAQPQHGGEGALYLFLKRLDRQKPD